MTSSATHWQNQLPYKKPDQDFSDSVRYTATCYCGAVQYVANADPVDAKYCHCRACQTLHGAPFQWAAIFHKSAIRFTNGGCNIKFYNNDTRSDVHELPCKVLCAKCNSPLADEGRNMFMAFPTQFKFPQRKVPDTFKVSCHIFYGQRPDGISINDGKPKWSGHKEQSELLPD